MDDLERGRESYAARSWLNAYESLSKADRKGALGAAELELLATSAYMLGRDEEHVTGLERAHHAYVEAGEGPRAARCAFWMAINLMLRGELSRANGWLSRAQRLIEREGRECAEHGYLLLPAVIDAVESGDREAGYATAAEAVAIGERHGDADLVAFAVHWQGCARVKQGRVGEGLGLLDEAMVAVTAGELSPIVTGLIYCSVIEACHEVHALRQAREWTTALTRWCEDQPDMVAFTGRCLIHRAEIMQLEGAWPDALEEARRAGRRLAEGMNRRAGAEARYHEGELHRLRGELDAAEAAFREASLAGWEPQPGLALLRLAQRREDAASAAIRRVVAETTGRGGRTRLLPAYVEIMLSVGDLAEARSACRELEQLATGEETGMLGAMAAQARGAVDLAGGDARGALVPLRHACQAWQELDAPYEVARVRALVGLACRALSDEDAALLELEAARAAFERLGAITDLAHIDSLPAHVAPGGGHALTPRELQVLRLVAAGRTNKAIADELVLSPRTVDRHVSNIFAKLGVSSRAAATAYAYEHHLV